jgi:hypothetical protein
MFKNLSLLNILQLLILVGISHAKGAVDVSHEDRVQVVGAPATGESVGASSQENFDWEKFSDSMNNRISDEELDDLMKQYPDLFREMAEDYKNAQDLLKSLNQEQIQFLNKTLALISEENSGSTSPSAKKQPSRRKPMPGIKPMPGQS